MAWRRWWVWGVLVAALVVGAAGVSATRAAPEAESTAVVALTPRTGGQPLSAAQVALLSTKYVALASSDAVARDVARDHDLPLAVVQEGLRVSLPERTTTLRVSMRTPDVGSRPAAEVATEVVDAVTVTVVERASGDRYLTAEVVVAPDAVSAGSGRSRMLAAGLGLAVLLGLGLPVGLEGWRRRRPTAA